MRGPAIVTAVILVAGLVSGWRKERVLRTLRVEHDGLQQRAGELGIGGAGGGEDAGRAVAMRGGRPVREEERVVVKEFADRLLAFAREMKEAETTGKHMDASGQKRLLEALDGMYSLNGDQILELVADLEGRGGVDDGMKKQIIGFAVLTMAEQHPERTLTYIAGNPAVMKDNPMQGHILNTALGALARSNPDAAVAWLDAHKESHPGMVTEDTRRAVALGAAQQDIAAGFRMMERLDLRSDNHAWSMLASGADTPEKKTIYLDQARALGGGSVAGGEQLRNEALRNLFGRVAEDGLDKASVWMQGAGLTAEETSLMVGALNPFNTRDETARWVEWLAARPGEASAESAVGPLVRSWTEQDYQAAGNWLSRTADGPVKQSATLAYLQAVAPYDPENAEQWAETLPADKRGQAQSTILWSLRKKDPEAAKRFAEEHGLEVP